MTKLRIYEPTDPDMPPECRNVLTVMTRPEFGKKPRPNYTSGYEKFLAAREALHNKTSETSTQMELKVPTDNRPGYMKQRIFNSAQGA